MTDTARPLWTPSAERIANSGLTRYLNWLADTHGRRFDDYESLWQWSVDDQEGFWASLWDFLGVRAHSGYQQVIGQAGMPGAQWFPGSTLNFAEHLLAHAHHPDAHSKPAIVFRSEIVPRQEVAWSQLAADTGALTATLERLGLEVGDRAVAYMPNIPQTVVAMLATTSIGAIWSSSSPDMGPVSVLDRFRQIEPKVLYAVDGYRYGGKDFDRLPTVRELVRQLPTVHTVVLVPYLNPGASLEDLDAGPDAQGNPRQVRVVRWSQALAQPAAPRFASLPFDHPLWIVYSSGTTGMPKPIVHGHGGTTLENLKGNVIARDLSERDRFFWFSSTSWIMWNLWVGTLSVGCTALQFDGNPGHPDLSTLWRFAEQERATFFGISPAFIALNIKAGMKPREQFDLSALRTIGSTGSPLTEDAYRWIYEQVHPDVLLASISGGTDPGTAFLDSCPNLPIYAGEMQCRGLGSAVYSYDDAGHPQMEAVGELVCAKSMPSMPLYFWNDDGGRRYFESYFDTFPGPPNVWRHGDWLKLIRRPESITGVIYGRSDSTINRHGIRMGTSELYRVVEEFDEVADSLVVDLEYLGRDSYMALFVVLREPGSGAAGVGSKGSALEGVQAGASANANAAPGAGALGASAADTGVSLALKKALLDAIRTKLSSRHVPNDVFAIPEVPRTISGKKMEVPVKKILLGQPVEKSVNRDSMANPGSIDWFVGFAAGRGV
ncbi:MAG: acetoacetate--CoA ligase [Quisquiliibacterium sp.]